MLTIDALTAGYTQLPIIQDINMNCSPGSIVALIGPNGSGKSTLLKAVAGLLKPMAGRVKVNGADVTGLPAYRTARHGIGYVPQLNNVFVGLTVEENLEMGAYSMSGSTKSRRAEVLETFPDLLAARGKKAGHLSGGQRNLLAVARAMMLRPKVLLVDEPTAGLAPINTKRIWDQLRSISHAGTAVLVAEQNVDLALEAASRAYVMVAGTIRRDGAAADVRALNLHAIFLGH